MRGNLTHHRHRRLAVPATLAAAALLIAGCGTRASETEVLAGAGGGPARIEPSVLEQLQSSGAAAGSGTAGAPLATQKAPIGGDAAAPGAEAAPGAAAGIAAALGGQGESAPVASGAGTAAPGATGAAEAAGGAANATGKGTPAKQRAGKGAGGQQAGAQGQAAGKTAAAGARADAPCTEQGAPLALGQVGSFSGVAGPITASARTAMAVWAKDINARGGLACHPVVLFPADDGADPARTAAAVQDLTQNKNVQAIVGAFTALSQSGLNSAVEKAGIPVVGGDVIDFSWNSHPNLFPQGAGILGAVRGALQQTIGSGKTKLGLLYCVEATVCTTGAKVIEEETAKLGGDLVYSAPVSLTQTEFTAQCQSAKNAGVQALGAAVEGATMGRIARSCAALGYHPQFVSSALVLSPKQAEDPNIRKNTLSTANANAPFVRTDTPGQREYQAAMKRYAPGLIPDGASTQAWASGKLLEAAIAGLGPEARTKPITTAMIFKGLGTIKNETLDGLAPPITFAPGQQAAPVINCSFLMLLTSEGWSAESSKPICIGEEGKAGDKGGAAQQSHGADIMAAPRSASHRTAAAHRRTVSRRS